MQVTCGEMAIVLCYFQLCNEDYHWWWRSFFNSGSCAAYTMLCTAEPTEERIFTGVLRSDTSHLFSRFWGFLFCVFSRFPLLSALHTTLP